jgi:hypothetical protein
MFTELICRNVDRSAKRVDGETYKSSQNSSLRTRWGLLDESDQLFAAIASHLAWKITDESGCGINFGESSKVSSAERIFVFGNREQVPNRKIRRTYGITPVA